MYPLVLYHLKQLVMLFLNELDCSIKHKTRESKIQHPSQDSEIRCSFSCMDESSSIPGCDFFCDRQDCWTVDTTCLACLACSPQTVLYWSLTVGCLESAIHHDCLVLIAYLRLFYHFQIYNFVSSEASFSLVFLVLYCRIGRSMAVELHVQHETVNNACHWTKAKQCKLRLRHDSPSCVSDRLRMCCTQPGYWEMLQCPSQRTVWQGSRPTQRGSTS